MKIKLTLAGSCLTIDIVFQIESLLSQILANYRIKINQICVYIENEYIYKIEPRTEEGRVQPITPRLYGRTCPYINVPLSVMKTRLHFGRHS